MSSHSPVGRFHSCAAILTAFATVALAQTPPPAPGRIMLDIEKLPRPPIPVDPLELVNSAQTAPDAQQRLAAIDLLNKAHDRSNVRARAYDLKTTFQTYGGGASDGTWMLQDTSPAPRMYRWAAQGPGYSSINYYPDSTQGMLYSNQPASVLPLRLMQVRDAIFFTYQIPGPQASVRTATASLNGAQQNCVLVVIGAGNRSFSGGRNWEESEYCVDARTGLLSTWSPAPGLFVQYDYSGAMSFHGRTIPGGFTITQGGQKIIEAKTVSIGDPPKADDAMFSTNGLSAISVGREMAPPVIFRSVMPVPGQRFPLSNEKAVMQVVLVHGTVKDDGHLGESEILASTDSSLNQIALQQAGTVSPRTSAAGQPGVTQPSHEVFFTFQFLTQSR